MKKFLVAIALLGFGFSAQADHHYEIQINGTANGTGGGVFLSDDGNDSNTAWGLGGEVYKSLNDKMQIGGVLTVADSGVSGSDTVIGLGVKGRYNLDSDLRDSMFFGLGLVASDVDNFSESLNLILGFGKRYALSDTITYTPNLEYVHYMDSDRDGYQVNINLISFSGFM